MNQHIIENKLLNGFSRMSKVEKLRLISRMHADPEHAQELLRSFWHADPDIQKRFDEFSENTLSNFHIPYGVVPNVIINDKVYTVPMVIEESSVVAAAANAAKFWANHGGFHATVASTIKVGQVHFLWSGDKTLLQAAFPEMKAMFFAGTRHLTANMVRRGGGIRDIELVDMTHEMTDYYQIKAYFDTRDSMGANFINSCLEEFARSLEAFLCQDGQAGAGPGECQVIMAILSNYTPDCRVSVHVEAPFSAFDGMDERLSGEAFVRKFAQAVEVARLDVFRAATHNKGIFNGVDAVALATGNDFRAIEACGHTYASRDGQYRSLTRIQLQDGIFSYTLDLPLAMGAVGGLTRLHPLAAFSLELLGNPGGEELMMITATMGLANNFSALRSLVTKGIQVGHMKMHLLNILNHYHATDAEKQSAIEFFKDHKVSFNAVSAYLAGVRAQQKE